MALLSIAFSIVVAMSCDFVEVDYPENSNSNLTSLTIGQYRYNPDGEGCRKFTSDQINVSWEFKAGQIGLLIAVGTTSFLLCFLFKFSFACAFLSSLTCAPFLVISVSYRDHYPLVSPMLLLEILLQSTHYDDFIHHCHYRHGTDISHLCK